MNDDDKYQAARPIAQELVVTMRKINSNKLTIKQYKEDLAVVEEAIEEGEKRTLLYRNLLKELGKPGIELLEIYEAMI